MPARGAAGPDSLPDLAAAIDALRRGKTTARELFARCSANRTVAGGAYTTWAAASTVHPLRAADAAIEANLDTGLLRGIPISVKDVFGVAGMPVYAGSPRELPAFWRREGHLVRQVKRQLGVIVGKTHMVEFAFGGLGTNSHWGTPRNPCDPDRLPGGSSSGAAVSIAEGSALLALATDVSGSARVPASMTGTGGLKLTAGRWKLDGVVPLSVSLDTPGLIARNARDLALGFAALDGGDRDPTETEPPAPAIPSTVHLGVPGDFFWSDCSPGVAEAVERARGIAEQAGMCVHGTTLPGCDEAYGIFRLGGLAAPELDRFLSDELPEWRQTLDPAVRARIDGVAGMSAREYLQRLHRHRELARTAVRVFEKFDALLVPTVPITPPRRTDVGTPGAYNSANLLALRNTVVVNLLGLCAVTLPVGHDAAGMPVGMQLIGAPDTEERLLAVARTIETLVHENDDKPPS